MQAKSLRCRRWAPEIHWKTTASAIKHERTGGLSHLLSFLFEHILRWMWKIPVNSLVKQRRVLDTPLRRNNGLELRSGWKSTLQVILDASFTHPLQQRREPSIFHPCHKCALTSVTFIWLCKSRDNKTWIKTTWLFEFNNLRRQKFRVCWCFDDTPKI